MEEHQPPADSREAMKLGFLFCYYNSPITRAVPPLAPYTKASFLFILF